jgi:hypothetical protein
MAPKPGAIGIHRGEIKCLFLLSFFLRVHEDLFTIDIAKRGTLIQENLKSLQHL